VFSFFRLSEASHYMPKTRPFGQPAGLAHDINA